MTAEAITAIVAGLVAVPVLVQLARRSVRFLNRADAAATAVIEAFAPADGSPGLPQRVADLDLRVLVVETHVGIVEPAPPGPTPWPG